MIKRTIVVPRDSRDERTFAVVTFEAVTGTSIQENVDAIRSAVSTWLRTPEGQEEGWLPSSEDFNWGDLSGHTDNGLLQEHLAASGIHALTIETFVDCNSHNASYDDVFNGELPQ